MSGARRALGLGATLALAVTLCIALGGGSAARSVDVAPAPVPEGDCNPCPLSRVIVDKPAWDETVTVTDSPARAVHHHDLVTAEHTVARQVLTTPAHDESYQVWVTSGYNTQHWIDTSHYEWRTNWVTSGYWNSYWVDTSHWETRVNWVSSGYTYTYWVDTSHYDTQSYYVSTGYWSSYYVDTGGYWASRWRCPWDDDCYEITYWQPSGYWASYWQDTSYWATYTVWVGSGYYASQWIDTSHWEYQWVYISSGYAYTYWIDTSHYETTQLWVASGYYEQHWVDTGGYMAARYVPYRCRAYFDNTDDCDGDYYTSYWQPTGYWSTNFWVDTSHDETRQRWVDDVYTTQYETIPAAYKDWDEQIAAVTHTEVVHHAAVTHEVPITLDQLTTQNRQTAAGASSGTTGGADGTANTSPVTISVVSSITIVDKPATTTTRTIVDQAAYDEPRTVVDQAAYDDGAVHHDAVTHTDTVHHAAVVHTETVVTVPAVTHREEVKYTAAVGGNPPAGSSGHDPLLDFAFLAGLTALAGAGKYASRADELKAAVAQMAGLGVPIPAAVEPILLDSAPETAAQVDASIARAFLTSGDTSTSGDISSSTGTAESAGPVGAIGPSGPSGPSEPVKPGEPASQKNWWDQFVDNTKAKLREGAYAVAETGNTAAALTRAVANEVAETGNTAAALARVGVYDLAETGNKAARTLQDDAYGLATTEKTIDTIVSGIGTTRDLLSKSSRTPEENAYLFGPNAKYDRYFDAHTMKWVDVVTNADGVMGRINRAIGGKGNTMTMSDGLIVSDLPHDQLTKDTYRLRHEAGHISQADELGASYLPGYLELWVATALAQGENPLENSRKTHNNDPFETDANHRAGHVDPETGQWVDLTWGQVETEGLTTSDQFPFPWVQWTADGKSTDTSTNDFLDPTLPRQLPADVGGGGGGGQLKSLNTGTPSESEDAPQRASAVTDNGDTLTAGDESSHAAPEVTAVAETLAVPETATVADVPEVPTVADAPEIVTPEVPEAFVFDGADYSSSDVEIMA